MRKILHVISGLGTGGAEAMLVRLAGELRNRGFAQHVVSVSGRGAHADALEARGIGVTSLGIQSFASAPTGLLRLIRTVGAQKPDILQGWMYHGDLASTFAHALVMGRKTRKLLWNIRASNMDEGGYGHLLRLGAWFSRWPDVVLANSRAGLDFHVAQGYRPRHDLIIPNGIEDMKFQPDADARKAVRSELGLTNDAVVAIHVARVDPMKDHATFLKAMELSPKMTGLVVGKDTETLALPPNVKALGIRSDVERFYAASDIAVSTSIFGEGFSNAIAEGMSTGLVPVATDVGDARLIVGDTGTIVPSRDPVALAGTFAVLASLPKDELRARGLNARARIVNNFTLSKAVDRFAQLYTEI